MNDQIDRELVAVLRQIVVELREMNGKDADGNRPQPPFPTWAEGLGIPRFDHQGENAVE